MSIQIKTRLHDGIYKSDGGGQTRTHYEWSTGPRNLLDAIGILNAHSAAMTRGYGNIGHCRSWLEIDGVEIPEWELADFDRSSYQLDMAEYRITGYGKPRTLTQRARELIADAQSGELISRWNAVVSAIEAEL